MVVAMASLTDLSRWARSSGLEIMLLVTGSALLARFASWMRDRITARIDAESQAEIDALVRSEQAKHRHALGPVSRRLPRPGRRPHAGEAGHDETVAPPAHARWGRLVIAALVLTAVTGGAVVTGRTLLHTRHQLRDTR
ncbi:MAG: hypothetical protein LC713_04595, partial [Actinobacteria bacterium]|nr:hypothetical protein [Actinomycetota bacterium]